MILTDGQKPIFRTIYIPGLIALIYFGILWFGAQPAYDEPGPVSVTLWAKLLPFFYPLFWAVCWGWDWLVTKDYRKFAVLLGIAFLHWLIVFEMNMLEKLTSGSGTRFMYLLTLTVLSPVVWYGVARDLIENARKPPLAGLAAGILLTLADQAFARSAGRVDELLSLVNGISRFISGDNLFGIWWLLNGARLLELGFYVLLPAVVLWTYYLANNLTMLETPSIKEVFVEGYYNYISGRRFAMLYPVFYLTCFGCCVEIAQNLQLLFAKRMGGRSPFGAAGLLRVLLFSGTLYVFYYLCRSLVISRCIALRQRIGFMYYLALIPVLNIIPFFYFTLSRRVTDAEAEIAYAAVMNDPGTARHRFTTGFIIAMACVPVLLMLYAGAGNFDDGPGVFGLLITVLQIILLAAMISQPRAKYWFIGFQVMLVFLSLHGGGEVRYEAADQVLLRLCYVILAVNWYEKIFHPDVFMDVDYGFGEKELNGDPDLTTDGSKAGIQQGPPD